MAEAVKSYEITYLIAPTVSEDEARTVADSVRSIIGSYDAEVDSWDTPRRRTLAYLIGNDREVYAGAFRFKSVTEKIPELEKKIKNERHILRTLLIKWKKQPERRAYIKPATIRQEEQVPTDEKALEAKLKEILGEGAPHESQ